MPNNPFLIPTLQPQAIASTLAMASGEIATILLAEARNNRPQVNPYIKGVISILPSVTNKNPYLGQINQSDLADPELYKSDLGTSVFADVTFGSVTYTDANGKQITTPSLTFQAILISITFPRNIVKTTIQGKDGTVKEYIGEGDAQISFRGVITGANGQYPSDSIAQLKKVIKAPISIPVISTHLQNMDIHAIVFEDRTFEQEEGGYSYLTFSLNAISDTPTELQITAI